MCLVIFIYQITHERIYSKDPESLLSYKKLLNYFALREVKQELVLEYLSTPSTSNAPQYKHVYN